MSQKQFCDEMFHNVRRMVNMDFPRAWKETRPYVEKFSTKLNTTAHGWQRVEAACCRVPLRATGAMLTLGDLTANSRMRNRTRSGLMK